MPRNPSLADVRARRAEIAKIIPALQAEDKELAAAESVLLRLVGGEDASDESDANTHLFVQTAADVGDESNPVNLSDKGGDEDESVAEYVKREIMSGNETIEGLIVLLLDNCRDTWWTANEIQNALKFVKDKDVPMSSVSPTLWNLRNKGIIVRQGLNVALKSKLEKNEAAPA
jgi:hypothetical protein